MHWFHNPFPSNIILSELVRLYKWVEELKEELVRSARFVTRNNKLFFTFRKMR